MIRSLPRPLSFVALVVEKGFAFVLYAIQDYGHNSHLAL
jgi:hypothetical protein